MSEKRNYNNRRHRPRNRRHNVSKNFVSDELCPLCNKPLGDLLTALGYGNEGKAVHFDCVVKEIEKTEELKERESICYLGNGSFGIVLNYASNSSSRFFIRKRIQFEEYEKRLKWRKDLSTVK